MRKLSIIVLILLLTSCQNDLVKEVEEKEEVRDMSSNLSPLYGTPTLTQYNGSPYAGSIGYISDGNESTMMTYYFTHSVAEEGIKTPWGGQYVVTLDMPRYVESIEIIWNFGTTGKDYIVNGSANIGYIKNGTYFQLAGPTFPVGENETTAYVGEEITGLAFTFYLVANHLNTGGSTYFNMKEIRLIGSAMTDSPIKVQTLYGAITLKQDEDLISPVRFKNGSGAIKSLQLCPTTNASASPVRIMTASGIKSIAK